MNLRDLRQRRCCKVDLVSRLWRMSLWVETEQQALCERSDPSSEQRLELTFEAILMACASGQGTTGLRISTRRTCLALTSAKTASLTRCVGTSVCFTMSGTAQREPERYALRPPTHRSCEIIETRLKSKAIASTHRPSGFSRSAARTRSISLRCGCACAHHRGMFSCRLR